MTKPLRSNRERISPSRPRRTASGLMSTSERSVELDTEDPPAEGVTRGQSAYRYHDSGERQRRDHRTFAKTWPGNNLTGTTRRSTVANQAGRPIAPARKLVAAVMGTIAVFVVAVGLGMSSWAVAVFGIAVLALSIALAMVNVVRRGARAWVAGNAEVKAISPPPASASVYGRAEIQVVVVAPGLPTSEVTIRDPRVPVVKWPMAGDTLPITVDVDDMRRVRINWDEAVPRNEGEAPPPPPTTPGYDEPDEDDDLDNDLLGDVEPPPWSRGEREWGRGPDEPDAPPEQDDYDDAYT